MRKNKIVLISPTCSNNKIKLAGDYVFRIWPSDAYQGKVIADFLFNTLRKRNVAVIYIMNEYGTGLKDEFVNNLESLGGSVVAIEGFKQGETDFRSILARIKEATPEAIFLSSHYKESALILRQAKELGIESQFIGGDGNFAPELIDLSGGAAEGMIVTNMKWSPGSSDPIVKNFVIKYKEKYGREPEVYAAAGYDCLKVVADAIAKGGYNSEGIKNALYNIKEFEGVTGKITFDEFGEIAEKEYEKFIVKNGKFVPYED